LRLFWENQVQEGRSALKRSDGRSFDALRPVKITRDYLKHPEGAVLIEMGDTKVICTASLEEKVPPFLRNTGKGWITAEYSMLPRATHTRTIRESTAGRASGRSFEIQRLIGRSLRSVTDLNALGEKSVWIDCDVIQADGGTRTASITGAYIALVDAFQKMVELGRMEDVPVRDSVAAISVGKTREGILLDLNYEEDSRAHVDMNIVMTGSGKFVEIQGTGEESVFSEDDVGEMMKLAQKGIKELTKIQKKSLEGKGKN
jgi:ribonuclease PH